MNRKLKICYLAPANSVHTERWARHFASVGHDVSVVSLTDSSIDFEPVYSLGMPGGVGAAGAGIPEGSGRPDFLQILKAFKPARESVRIARILAIRTLYSRKAKKIIDDIAPDVIHAQTLFFYGFLGSVIGAKPLIATAWGSEVLRLPNEATWYSNVFRKVFASADLITSMAGHMTEVLVEMGADRSKIVENAWGVDDEIFNLRGREITSETIISTRNFKEVYDVGVLIEALPLIKRENPDAKIVLVGGGPLRSDLEKRSRQLNCFESVKFLGHIDQASISKLLKMAEIYVSMSKSDGTSQSLLEAMACGACPIVSDIPANREWIQDGVNGFLVPVGDHKALAERLIYALNNADFLEGSRETNLRIIEEKGIWRKNMDLMERIYFEYAKGYGEE